MADVCACKCAEKTNLTLSTTTKSSAEISQCRIMKHCGKRKEYLLESFLVYIQEAKSFTQ